MEPRGSDSHASEALIKYWLGTPNGWTTCAYIGLCARVSLPFFVIEKVIDTVAIEREHCHHSTMRSIERGKDAEKS